MNVIGRRALLLDKTAALGDPAKDRHDSEVLGTTD
jgi:hypothetical protein